VYRLLREEYWKRAWIVPEIGVAARLQVCFGRQSLPWEDFITAIQAYHACAGDGRANQVLNLDLLRKAKFTDGESFSLTSLLSKFHDCFCENPRDKIYAFLGVDYNKSLNEVYEDMMKSYEQSEIEPSFKMTELLYVSALIRRSLRRDSKKKFELTDCCSVPTAGWLNIQTLSQEMPSSARNCQ
jgi:hypothetical protein